jgi:predicted cupin superfamily sugar epimerase
VFHFYLGDPLEGLLLYPDGSSRTVTLGRDILGGEHVQFVVPAGVWQGWRVRAGGAYAYALTGTTMAPGYTQADFELGSREQLTWLYPGRAEGIRRLTR